MSAALALKTRLAQPKIVAAPGAPDSLTDVEARGAPSASRDRFTGPCSATAHVTTEATQIRRIRTRRMCMRTREQAPSGASRS